MLSDAFFVAAYSAVGAALVLLLLLYLRVRKLRQPPAAKPVQDFTNMVILLQTMREIIHKQKGLANQFNQNVENKVNQIKELMGATLEEHRILRKAQRELAQRLEEIRTELATIHAQTNDMGEVQQGGEHLPPAFGTHPPETPESEGPLLRVMPPPEPGEEHGDIVDTWVGLDFDRAEEEPETSPVPAGIPEQPEEPGKAREAFRALLNMDTEDRDDEPPGHAPDNGRDAASLLRGRVYEYKDAGMTIAQTARELGIGKGEVRLILGLRGKAKRIGS